MAVEMSSLLADLSAETSELEQLLAPLDASGWEQPTPAEGWRVHDQVVHLAFFDHAATISAIDPTAFRSELEEANAHSDGITERVRRRFAGLPADEVLSWFRDERSAMVSAFSELDPSTRVPWYGPEMSVASSLTARIMETWAHGQDLADALGATRAPTRALQQVAHLGVRTLANSFRTRGLLVPDDPVRVALRAPDGESWSWGDASGAQRVSGDALEFCLVVTQRRHVDDTTLVVEGGIAEQWMAIAQAFAGPPGVGRAPTKRLR
jgi:uncharacterized protein (TIGR03084 family)